jgi:UDP-glucuronate 4-epimerase
VKLDTYIRAIEQDLGRTAIRELLPLQPGDVPDTYADVTPLTRVVGYKPATSVEEGVRRFVEWCIASTIGPSCGRPAGGSGAGLGPAG